MSSNGNTWAGKIVGAVVFVLAFYAVKTFVTNVRSERAYEDVLESIDQGTFLDEFGAQIANNPYEFVRDAYSEGGSEFLEAFMQGAELTMQRNAPGAALVWDRLAEVTDLGSAMRAIARYTGNLPVEDAGVQAVIGEARSYYHSSGVLVLEAVCFMNLSTCTEMTGLVEQAESQVLQQLGSSAVGRILPGSRDCTIEDFTNALSGVTSDMAFCWYDPATFLSLIRYNSAEALGALASTGQDPEVKQMLRDLIREAVE